MKIMDKSDLQAIIRFASQNNILHKPFQYVVKWYRISNSLTLDEHTVNTFKAELVL